MSHMPPPYYPPPQPPLRWGRFVAWVAAACVGAALVGGGVALLTRGDGGSDRTGVAPSASAAPAPSPSVSVSEECRAWIRSELLDDSEDIDATAGYGVCGELSDAELGAAIDSVAAELSAEITPEP